MKIYARRDNLLTVADAWYSVFSGDKYPDGRSVEKVFVTGNHGRSGYAYGGAAEKKYPDEMECAKHILQKDMAGWWKNTFCEPYALIYSKKIKGYTFIGAHWDMGGVGAESGKEVIPAETVSGYKVIAPPVLAGDKARLFSLEFTVETLDGKKRTRRVIAVGFNHSLAHKKTKSRQVCYFRKDELGKGNVCFTVVPMSCFGMRGKSITRTLGWVSRTTGRNSPADFKNDANVDVFRVTRSTK